MFEKFTQWFKSDKNKATKSETKNTSQSREVVTLDTFTQNIFFSNNYRTLAKEGYMENVIAFHCIDKIATCAQNIPVEISINGKEIDAGSTDRLAKSLISNLLSPNADQTGKQFIHAELSHRMIAGEYYAWTDVTSTGVILDTQSLRPDRMTKTTNGDERILQFIYTRGSGARTFERNDDGYFDILYHLCFNPNSDVDGLSPLSAGGMSLNQYNEANLWNKGLFENGAKSSGIFTMGTDDEGAFEAMDEPDVKAIADDINAKMKRRNGGISVVNAPGRLDLNSMTPMEMDFLNGQKRKAIEICNALNFPPYLLGIEGATFNNQKEAKESLYEEAVIPLIEEFYENYGIYHSRLFDKRIEYKLDLKGVTALAEKRERQRESARKDYAGGIISQDEARDEGGRDALPFGGDIFVTQNAPNAQDFQNNQNAN